MRSAVRSSVRDSVHLLRFAGTPPHRRIAMVWRRSSAMGDFLLQLAQLFRELPSGLLEVEPSAPTGTVPKPAATRRRTRG